MLDFSTHHDDAAPHLLADDGRPARGPLRPARLVSARRRHDRRLAAHRFRAVDVAFAAVAALVVVRVDGGRPILATTVADVVPAVVTVWAASSVLAASGGYAFGRSERPRRHLARIVGSALVGVVVGVLGVLLLSSPGVDLVDVVVVGAVWAAGITLLHALWWTVVRRWRARELLTPNVVVVGATDHAEDLIEATIDGGEMNILGVFDDRLERSPLAVRGVPVLGSTDDLARHRVMPYVDLVVVAVDPSAAERVAQITDRLTMLPTPVALLLDDLDPSRRTAAIDRLSDASLAPLRSGGDDTRRAFVKRLTDLAIGTTALVLAAPVMAVIAVAIRRDSDGPVFFRQGRQGFGNEEISVWKFRTMHEDLGDPLGVRQVTSDDERVTRVGRVLRSTSLDELPQLFNVIRGEMSLVGPRPHAVGMKTGDVDSCELVRRYAHRHRIKPGMTGWAAIHGSRGPLHVAVDVQRRVALDVDYIERQSFWLDLSIMARTLPSMLGDRDAIR